MADYHVGRSFTGHGIEDRCPCPQEPCPQEPCGLVDLNKAVPECLHHWIGKAKTIRQGHLEDECPGGES